MSDDAPLEPISPEPATPGEGAPSAPGETTTQTQVPPVAATPTTPAPVPPAAGAPTQPVAGTTPPGPPPWGQPPSDSGTPGSPRSSTVAVPKWLLVAVGALVIALIGFGVGYAVAPGGGIDSSASTRVVPNPFGGNGGLSPDLNPNGNGNGGGNGNRGQLPTIPGQGNLSGGFLGVVSSASTSPDGA